MVLLPGNADKEFGVRLGLVWAKPTLAHPVLYLLAATLRLALKLFRGEPAITRLG